MIAKALTNTAIKGDLKSASFVFQTVERPKEDAQKEADEPIVADTDLIKRIRTRVLRDGLGE